MNSKLIDITHKDFQEIFALFSSPTKAELEMIYNPSHHLFFEKENLEDEYDLAEEKKEFAIDAARAVLYWLRQHGYQLTKDGKIDDLSWLENELFV